MNYFTFQAKQSGFTIVELLIVIVVIAILAAISVATYTGIQDRAVRTAVMSDMANFHKKIEMVKVDTSDGLYPLNPPSTTGAAPTKDAYALDRSNWFYCRVPARTEYLLSVLDSRGRTYFLRMGGNVEEGGNFDGATRYSKLGSVDGTGCTDGYTWNSTTSTGTWSSWTN